MKRLFVKFAAVLILLACWSPLVLADEIKLKISKKDCQWLTVHVPADDVRYKPGVDVRGKKVVPADLSSSRTLKLQDQVLLSLDIPLQEFIGAAAAGRLATADVNVGQISIDTKTREVFYNGQSISPDGQGELVAACRKMDKAKR